VVPSGFDEMGLLELDFKLSLGMRDLGKWTSAFWRAECKSNYL